MLTHLVCKEPLQRGLVEGGALAAVASTSRTQQVEEEEEAEEEEESQNLIRVRSIQRKHHDKLKVEHFGQDPLTNSTSVRSVTMRPSVGGMQILMSRESKTLSNTVNAYRHMTVSGEKGAEKLEPRGYRLYCYFFRTASIPSAFPLGQNRCFPAWRERRRPIWKRRLCDFRFVLLSAGDSSSGGGGGGVCKSASGCCSDGGGGCDGDGPIV